METELKMKEIIALLGKLAEKLEIKDPYYSVSVDMRSDGRAEYKAYLSFGDRLNDSIFFSSSDGLGEVVSQIDEFMETKDSVALSIMYHEKQIESNKHTIGFHERTIKALKAAKEGA